MKVQAVQVRNFRSIFHCELTSCGGFNVLIGKNNSGKSNILSAIHAFFSAVSDGAVVCLDPLINKDVDFYNKDSASPADVTLSFLLDKEERESLIAGLIEDSPQVTNAVNSLDSESCLRVRIRFSIDPIIYAYVNRISLVSQDENGASPPDAENVILDVNPDAGLKLYEKYRQYQHDETRITALKEFLSHIDRDAWMRLRRDFSEDLPGYRRPQLLGRRVSADPATLQLVESTMRDSTTYEDFFSTLQAEIDTSSRYVANSDKHGLDQAFVETFSGRASAIPKHILTILKKLSEIKLLNVTDDRRPIGREEAQRLLNLKTQRGGQEPLKKIQDIVFTLLGVQIDAFSGEQTVRMGRLSAELDVDDFVVEVNGSGIKEALRLLLDIEFQKPDLLLVEEPEIHLHPRMETTMMRYLKEVSHDRQMFITTHSTNFLDSSGMKNIYLVSKAESTGAQLLEQGEVEEQIPVELGIRLSSLFIYDRLVFVESQTDEEILRAWASTCGVNLDQANVGFIHMGGSRSLSYFAANATLSFLAKRQVRMWFMIDRDEKEEEDIRQIIERLGNNAVASVLGKREIENYLIHPRILVDQITCKLRERGICGQNLPNREEIEDLIEESAEDLKGIAIFKRVAKKICRPLYPAQSRQSHYNDDKTPEERVAEQVEVWATEVADLKSTIASETKKQTEEVERRWNEHKLEIVPGDWLIDMVYRHYSVRFRKERGDGVDLAKLMTKDEIGSEVEVLIKNIGT